ncbi:MAG: glutamine--fructose-6-phosphate transaminase (isomerizing) [Bacteroidota bacterium]
MCGIVAYIGRQKSYPILLQGLKRLEYRGYDSAGVALMDSSIKVHKQAGRVADLEHTVANKDVGGHIGIGHTRWATHGAPTNTNAHPHLSASGRLAVVHNGIVENHDALKRGLIEKGYTFSTETDTEVLAYFIEDVQQEHACTLAEAVKLALSKVVGAYALVVISEDFPETLVAVRRESPMVIGVGESEFFIASDATPIAAHTDQVIYMEDNEMAVIHGLKLTLKSENDVPLTPYIQKLDMELETIEKGRYAHFMLKEIFEQPQAIRNCMRGRLDLQHKQLVFGGLDKYMPALASAPKITLVACGTSWHAGLVAEYLIETLCRIPVEVEYASEFRYRNPVIHANDIVIAISQSGETADTLAAITLAKERGATVLGVCNVVASSIARAAHAGIYTHAGPEIGVASTKAFTTQLMVLAMLALALAHQQETISQEAFHALLQALAHIPGQIEDVLQRNTLTARIAHAYQQATNFLYLGRGYNFPVALEGALKLKELSYLHAEGYPAAEMKHGPIALVDEAMPVVFIATQDQSYQKIISNMEEIKARGGKIIAIINPGDQAATSLADHTIEVPRTHEAFTPLLSVVPLQLLAYHMAVALGHNVDRPRNLAKSVTVE